MDKDKHDWVMGLVVLIILCSFIYLTMFVSVNKFKNDVIGKSVETACSENWICGEWSECEDGLQFRGCIDVNRCLTELKKPDEIKTCSNGEESSLRKLGMGIRSYRFGETLGISLVHVSLLAALVLVFSSLAFTLIAKEISNRKLEAEKKREIIGGLSLTRLANYIQREINCGYTKNQIIEKLTSEGWNKKSIDDAFSMVKIQKRESILLENNWKMDLSKKIEDEFKSYNKR